MRVGQARKRDANEPAIIHALEEIGVQVQQLSIPDFADLIAYHPREGVRLLEVKNPMGRNRVTVGQAALAEDWPICVVRTVADALALFGVVVY